MAIETAQVHAGDKGGDKGDKNKKDNKGDGGGDDAGSLNSIKSGRLARYGVTAGLAIDAHLPFRNNLHSIGTGGMAYIESIPLVFTRRDITRTYCVTSGTAANAQDAADQASLAKAKLSIKSLGDVDDLTDNDLTIIFRDDKLTISNIQSELTEALKNTFPRQTGDSRSRGSEEIATISNDINVLGKIVHSDLSEAQLRALSPAGIQLVNETINGQSLGVNSLQVDEISSIVENTAKKGVRLSDIAAALSSPPALSEQDREDVEADQRQVKDARQGLLTRAQFKALNDESKKVIVKRFVNDEVGWEIGKQGDCKLWGFIPVNLFGVYIGLPSTFNANVTVGGSTREKAMDFSPQFSIGLTVSPIAEVRLMVGLTRSNINSGTKDDPHNVASWDLTIGLGGNFDIAGALLGK
jgi:hypothetical protein